MTQPLTPSRPAQPPGKRFGYGLGSLLPFLTQGFRSRPHGPGEESVLGFIDSTRADDLPPPSPAPASK